MIAGSNDGMLHAFRESDGVELWGLVPPDLLGKLKHLSGGSASHTYFVDSSPVAADVKIGGAWKTVVIFGERRGGRYYHALDVTDTTNPAVPVGVHRHEDGRDLVRADHRQGQDGADGTDRYVAFFGGGYDTAENNNTGRPSSPWISRPARSCGSITRVRRRTHRPVHLQNYSIPANPLALDLNNNGYIDRVYIGDIDGQVWRFDMSDGTTLAGDSASTTGPASCSLPPAPTTTPPPTGEYYPAQAIYSAINAAWGDSANAQLWLYFGTGDRNHPNAPAANRFYGIKDNTGMTNGTFLTESSLVDVTSTSTAATQGWYYPPGGQ